MSKYNRSLTKEEQDIIQERICKLIDSKWPRRSCTYYSDVFEVSPKTVADYYRGRSTPSIHTMMRIAEHFHTSIDYICGRTDKR